MECILYETVILPRQLDRHGTVSFVCLVWADLMLLNLKLSSPEGRLQKNSESVLIKSLMQEQFPAMVAGWRELDHKAQATLDFSD